jgi:hypothetical protein
LAEFVHTLFATIMGLSGGIELLCLTDEHPTRKSPVSDGAVPVQVLVASCNTETDDSLPVLGASVEETCLSDFQSINQQRQRMFEAKKQAKMLIDRRRRVLAQRQKDVEDRARELRHKIARMEQAGRCSGG